MQTTPTTQKASAEPEIRYTEHDALRMPAEVDTFCGAVIFRHDLGTVFVFTRKGIKHARSILLSHLQTPTHRVHTSTLGSRAAA